MVCDAFEAHTTDEMKAVLLINRTNLIMVPPVVLRNVNH